MNYDSQLAELKFIVEFLSLKQINFLLATLECSTQIAAMRKSGYTNIPRSQNLHRAVRIVSSLRIHSAIEQRQAIINNMISDTIQSGLTGAKK